MTDLREGAPAPAATARGFGWPETRDVIATVSTLGLLAAYAAPWFAAITQGADNYVGQMRGALITQWAGVIKAGAMSERVRRNLLRGGFPRKQPSNDLFRSCFGRWMPSFAPNQLWGGIRFATSNSGRHLSRRPQRADP